MTYKKDGLTGPPLEVKCALELIAELDMMELGKCPLVQLAMTAEELYPLHSTVDRGCKLHETIATEFEALQSLCQGQDSELRASRRLRIVELRFIGPKKEKARRCAEIVGISERQVYRDTHEVCRQLWDRLAARKAGLCPASTSILPRRATPNVSTPPPKSVPSPTSRVIPVTSGLPERPSPFVERYSVGKGILTELICDELAGRQYSAILLWGVPGIGKTTLMREVNYRCVDEGLFDHYFYLQDTQELVSKKVGDLLDGSAKPLDSAPGESETPNQSAMPGVRPGEVVKELGKQLANRVPSNDMGADASAKTVDDDIGRLCDQGERILLSVEAIDALTRDDLAWLLNLCQRFANLELIATSNTQLLMQRMRDFRVELRPMTQTEACELLQLEQAGRAMAQQLSPDAVAQANKCCAGNPLALQWLAGLCADQQRELVDVVERLSPENVSEEDWQELFGELFSRMNNDQRRLLCAISLFPRPMRDSVLYDIVSLAPSTPHYSGAQSSKAYPELDRLVSLRLVTRVNRCDGEYYFMHQLAHVLLRATPGVDGIKINGWIDDFARSAAGCYAIRLSKMETPTLINEMRGDGYHNVREMLAWCRAHGHSFELCELFRAVSRTWSKLGLVDDRIEWAKEAIAHSDTKDANWFKVHDVAFALTQQGRTEDAEKVIAEVWAEIKNSLEDDQQMTKALCLRHMGNFACWHDRYPDAEEHLVKAVCILNKLNEQELLGATYGSLANVYRHEGAWAQAIKTCKKALACRRDIHDEGKMSQDMSDIAYCLAQLDEVEKAIRKSAKALAISCKYAPPSHPHAYNLYRRAQIEAGHGDRSIAYDCLCEADQLCDRLHANVPWPGADERDLAKLRDELNAEFGEEAWHEGDDPAGPSLEAEASA